MQAGFGKWLRAMNVRHFAANVSPVTLGAAVAWHETGRFNLTFFLLTLLGTFLANGAANIVNDYFDYISGNDPSNPYRSPFSGGSGVIVDGLLSPAEALRGGKILFGVAVLIGIYLSFRVGLPVIWFTAFGLFAGYYYSALPVSLMNRGLGEVILGLAFGPGEVMGSYYVQAQSFSWGAFFASIPVMISIVAVLYINQFPDFSVDSRYGKKNWVVRLGLRKAVRVYCALMAGVYISTVILILGRAMPPFALVCFLNLWASVKAINTARKYSGNPRLLLPANSLTARIHLMLGFLLGGGYIVGGVLK